MQISLLKCNAFEKKNIDEFSLIVFDVKINGMKLKL